MSPIGRVFIILNLLLAGAFVGFAGTYLQQATDWKSKHAGAVVAHAEEKTSLEEQVTSHQRARQDAERELAGHTMSLSQKVNDNKRLTEENQRLSQQLSDLAADVKKLQSGAITIAGAVQQATADAKQAYNTAQQATKDKDSALTAQETAEKNLADANFKIGKLEGQIAEQAGQIAGLQGEVGEKDVLLTFVQRRYPGVLSMAQPDLQGTVHRVDAGGKLITIEITANPEKASIERGYTMSIYAGNIYKGEAVITDVKDERFAFASITKKMDGARIAAGDKAATNVGIQ